MSITLTREDTMGRIVKVVIPDETKIEIRIVYHAGVVQDTILTLSRDEAAQLLEGLQELIHELEPFFNDNDG